MHSLYIAVVIALALPALLTSGCSTPPQTSLDPLATAPEDFSIDLTILCGKDADDRPEAHLRPGRFVVFADGSLHYGWEKGRGPNWLPGWTRTLNRRQVAELWSLAQQIGFTDRTWAIDPVNFSLIEPPRDGLVYLIGFSGAEERWAFIRPASGAAPPDPASVTLVRRLADLAWATDLPEERIRVVPLRYDMGPDPYARYRKNDASD